MLTVRDARSVCGKSTYTILVGVTLRLHAPVAVSLPARAKWVGGQSGCALNRSAASEPPGSSARPVVSVN